MYDRRGMHRILNTNTSPSGKTANTNKEIRLGMMQAVCPAGGNQIEKEYPHVPSRPAIKNFNNNIKEKLHEQGYYDYR